MLKIFSIIKSIVPFSILAIFSLSPPIELDDVLKPDLIKNIEWQNTRWIDSISANWEVTPVKDRETGLKILKSGPKIKVGSTNFKTTISDHKIFGKNFRLGHFSLSETIDCKRALYDLSTSLGVQPVIKVGRVSSNKSYNYNEMKSYWLFGKTGVDFSCYGSDEKEKSFAIASVFLMDAKKIVKYTPYIYLTCKFKGMDKTLDFVLDDNNKNIYNERHSQFGTVEKYNELTIQVKMNKILSLTINRKTGKFKIHDSKKSDSRLDVNGSCYKVDSTKAF